MTKEVDKSSPAFLQDKLWDEITKSIADRMPNQLFLLFKEAFGKEYPKGTAIRIQKYSLEDIREKHLTMFIPFKLLSFRPRVYSKKNPIRENELTEYVKRLILILEEEYEAGNISNLEYKDYVKFINLAAERVFHAQQHYAEEVFEVTKSVLELPSDIYRKAEMAEKLRQELDATKEEFSQREEEFKRRIAQLEAQLKTREE